MIFPVQWKALIPVRTLDLLINLLCMLQAAVRSYYAFCTFRAKWTCTHLFYIHNKSHWVLCQDTQESSPKGLLLSANLFMNYIIKELGCLLYLKFSPVYPFMSRLNPHNYLDRYINHLEVRHPELQYQYVLLSLNNLSLSLLKHHTLTKICKQSYI